MDWRSSYRTRSRFVFPSNCIDLELTGRVDQRLALPSDSYLVNYFNALDEFLDVGPPVYFVMQDVDVRARKRQQEVSGRFSTSDPFSLANILEAERKRPESSLIAEPPLVPSSLAVEREADLYPVLYGSTIISNGSIHFSKIAVVSRRPIRPSSARATLIHPVDPASKDASRRGISQ